MKSDGQKTLSVIGILLLMCTSAQKVIEVAMSKRNQAPQFNTNGVLNLVASSQPVN
jgi:hypothetical protein